MLSENFGEHHIWWLIQSFFPNIAMNIYAKSHRFSDERPLRLFGHRIFQTLSKTVVGLLPGGRDFCVALCKGKKYKKVLENFSYSDWTWGGANFLVDDVFASDYRSTWSIYNCNSYAVLLRNIHILMSKRILLVQLTIVYCVEYKHIHIYIYKFTHISTGAIYYIYIYLHTWINKFKTAHLPRTCAGCFTSRNTSWGIGQEQFLMRRKRNNQQMWLTTGLQKPW